jgi:hypothetical protein
MKKEKREVVTRETYPTLPNIFKSMKFVNPHYKAEKTMIANGVP